MEQFDALEVIAHTRGKVDMDSSVQTGGGLFPLWGWLTAVFYSLAFILWQLFHQDWCLWMWIGIPVVGFPIMFSLLRKDHERTHIRTRRSKLVLDYWIFAACVIGIGGFLFGFAGLYEVVENPLICLLVGIGASIGLGAFLLQGDLWVWQELCVVATAVSALIVPGHLFERNGV